ncbi:MAG: hypothetical protein PUJ72_04475 [Eubacteriales bacterium]|nr:hypothetical protein [Eubacteriales bacterium]MDY5354927.1 hypothetical protein [Eubacteriales bacterium]
MINTNGKEKNLKWLIIILSVGIVICTGVTIWAVFFRGGDDISPDYPPQGIESNQTPIDGDDSGKLESPEGGGAINVTYGTAATVDLSEKTVTIYYANPNASNQNVSILIMVNDLVVAKSDLITPGNQVSKLELQKEAASRLQVGGYNAELVVRAYDPESGEKAMVDTKGELTLTVTE